MIAWRWSREGMGVEKAGERRGQKPPPLHPPGPSTTEATQAPSCSQPVSHIPPHSAAPILRASVGASGSGSLGSGDTVTGHHLTCNMTQVKLKPAGRVPGPHPGGSRLVPGPIYAASQTRAPVLHLQPHRGFLEGPGTGACGMTLRHSAFKAQGTKVWLTEPELQSHH